jgi:mannose-6-phosphate isomerase-like protein (cupin superfamily)
MPSRNINNESGTFAVLQTSDDVQTVVMRLDPRKESGGMGNEHARSLQVLYVVKGKLRAEIGEGRFTMRAGDSTIVPRGMAHRFVNESSEEQALTFNVYVPPAYR